MLVLMDTFKQKLMDKLTGQGTTGLNPVRYHLYTNNVSPGHLDTLATYTEASFAGYAAVNVSSWGASTIDSGFHANSTASQISFTNSSGSSQNVYGYYVTDTGSGFLWYAELFAGAPIAIANGTSLFLTPVMLLTTGT